MLNSSPSSSDAHELWTPRQWHTRLYPSQGIYHRIYPAFSTLETKFGLAPTPTVVLQIQIDRHADQLDRGHTLPAGRLMVGDSSRWRCPESLGHSLDGVLAVGNVHDRHSWYLPDAPFEVLIARGNDVTPVLLRPLEAGHTSCRHPAGARGRP